MGTQMEMRNRMWQLYLQLREIDAINVATDTLILAREQDDILLQCSWRPRGC